jgi:hypothetical protein
VVAAVGGFDEGDVVGYEDWDLWIRITRAGYRGVIIPEPLFFYRRRQGSLSRFACHGEEHLRLMRYLYDKHEADYREHVASVLANRAAEIAGRLAHVRRLEGQVSVWLEPLVSHRRRMIEDLARKERALEAGHPAAPPLQRRIAQLDEALARAQQERAALTDRLGAALRDIELIRRSTSWRVTAPLRSLSRALRRRKDGNPS